MFLVVILLQIFLFQSLASPYSSHHMRFEGFILDPESGATGAYACVDLLQSDNIHFVDIECRNGHSQGFRGSGRNIELRRVYVHHTFGGINGGDCTSLDPPGPGGCHGFYVQTVGDSISMLITDSVFEDLNGFGIQIRDPGVIVKNTIFRNNYSGGIVGPVTAYNNVFADLPLEGVWGDSGTVYQNVFYNVGRTGIFSQVGGPAVANNLFVLTPNEIDIVGSIGGGNMCTTSQSGCAVVSAGGSFFINPGGSSLSDYRTHASSPAINAGVNLGSPYNVDPDGVMRPSDAYDVGAYEFTTAEAPLPTSLRLLPADP